MFTGIIEAVGRVAGTGAASRAGEGAGRSLRLEVELGPLAEGLTVGASVAVNGVCLTVAELRGTAALFDVVPETWRRSTLGELRVNDTVNLERSLRVGDRLDGHFVQGHVEGVGVVNRVDRAGGEWKLWIDAGPELTAAIIPKGAIAVDGTSLTVVDVHERRFSVALVPTTLARTVLGRRQRGDRVNIETDLLARLLIRRLDALTGGGAVAAGSSGLSLEKLQAGGYMP